MRKRKYDATVEKTDKQLTDLEEKKATLQNQMANPTELKKVEQDIDMKTREASVLSELESYRNEMPDFSNEHLTKKLKQDMVDMSDQTEGFHDRMSLRKDMKAADNVLKTFSEVEKELDNADADAAAASLIEEISDGGFDDF